MLRLIVQQLVHHIPGHAHGKEVYLPGEVLGLLVVLVVLVVLVALVALETATVAAEQQQ